MDTRRRLSDANFVGAVQDEWQLYSDIATDYTLGQPIGFGASSIVYQAEYHSPSGESIPCALKVLDIDSLPMNSLPLIRRETQLMSLSKHPNVLRVRGTWIDGHKLYIALRLMRSGSVADVMQYGWPEGVEEEVVKCILRQALEGLNYLHINGFIHRDVKAANLLIDDDGTVLLGDLGVAVALHDDEIASTRATILSTSVSDAGVVRGTTNRGKRKSFVGTPCWMAPEVIAQKHYDSKADIWSLGITALELAQGRAPMSRDPPHKVLIKIVQDDPPILDRKGGQFRYSKAFKEVIQSCLKKDPSERPTTEDLLQMSFFKNTKKKSFLVHTLLDDLPPLVDRQERRRIPSSLSHFSAISWDFTLPSPPNFLETKDSFNDGMFEMDDVSTTMNADSGRYAASRALAWSLSPSEDFVDEARSMPPVSTPSSYGEPLHDRQKPLTPTSIATTLSGTSGQMAEKSSSLSSSPGIWKKLKGMGNKGLVRRE